MIIKLLILKSIVKKDTKICYLLYQVSCYICFDVEQRTQRQSAAPHHIGSPLSSLSAWGPVKSLLHIEYENLLNKNPV